MDTSVCAKHQAEWHHASTTRANSQRLIEDISLLLLRFGVVARLKSTSKRGYRDMHQLHVGSGEHLRVYATEVGAFGPKKAGFREVLSYHRVTRIQGPLRHDSARCMATGHRACEFYQHVFCPSKKRNRDRLFELVIGLGLSLQESCRENRRALRRLGTFVARSIGRFLGRSHGDRGVGGRACF